MLHEEAMYSSNNYWLNFPKKINKEMEKSLWFTCVTFQKGKNN